MRKSKKLKSDKSETQIMYKRTRTIKKDESTKSKGNFDDAPSDDSGCTPMGQKFKSFVSGGSESGRSGHESGRK